MRFDMRRRTFGFVAGMLGLGLVTALSAAVAPIDTVSYTDAVRSYEEGQFEPAFTEFRRLAELGHGGAEFMLGVMYFYGRGVERDYSVASIWFYKSARQGNPAAQLAFGSMFIRGVGVGRDVKEAYKWLTLAGQSDLGPIAAQARALRMLAADTMSKTEIKEAEEAAAGFEPIRTGPLGLE